MESGKEKAERDIEKEYPVKKFVEKLRRLADCLERKERFRIQVAGERITVPPDALISIEHEREEGMEEIEFQLKWAYGKSEKNDQ
jgi:amphi-Trp domain-containing protein